MGNGHSGQPRIESGGDPDSRVPGENRDPVYKMAPDFRRDDVWTPVFTGETNRRQFFPNSGENGGDEEKKRKRR